MKWAEYMIRMAQLVSQKSKDETKVGCVLVGPENQVLSTGYNGFPRGVREVPEDVQGRWERPEKYKWIEHAERNAIYNAARHGISLRGATAFLNWEPSPCTDCARALIQAGITTIIGPDRPFGGVGAGTHYHIHDATRIMLSEASVRVITVPLTWHL